MIKLDIIPVNTCKNIIDRYRAIKSLSKEKIQRLKEVIHSYGNESAMTEQQKQLKKCDDIAEEILNKELILEPGTCLLVAKLKQISLCLEILQGK